MALETASYINGLVATNPTATDTVAQADDHIRLIKAAIKATFPNVTGAITATHTILNGLDARVTTLESTPAFPSGTRMLFQQSTAPTGWTKSSTHHNKAIRVTSASTVSSGGSTAFTQVDATPVGTITSSISGSVASHTLTTSQIPSHYHFTFNGTSNNTNTPALSSTNFPAKNNSVNAGNNGYIMTGSSLTPDRGRSQSVGGSGGHSHGVGSLTVSSSFTGAANQLDIAYVDVIIAEKD